MKIEDVIVYRGYTIQKWLGNLCVWEDGKIIHKSSDCSMGSLSKIVSMIYRGEI